MFRLNQDNERQSNEIRDLMEIIRWQFNPETARMPFAPMVKNDEKLRDVNQMGY